MKTQGQTGVRLALSIALALALVTALLPLTAPESADAATGDRTVKTASASTANAIDKVIFEERSDGRYDVYVHFDASVYNKSYYKDVTQWVVFDGAKGYIHCAWTQKTVESNSYTMKVRTSLWKDSSVAAGESVSLSAGGAYETYYNSNNLLQYRWACLQSGNEYVVTGAKDFTAPKAQASSELFKGFKAEYNAESAYVEVSYDSYSGSRSDYDQNIYLREDVETGKIKALGSIFGIGSYHYEQDSSALYDKTYLYYVVKRPLLKSKLPGFEDKVFEQDGTDLDAKTKATLQGISTSTSLTMPKPPVASVSRLKASAGIKKANLTWDLSSSGESVVSGYLVNVYTDKGIKYATRKYVPGYRDSSTATSVTIPYSGTYYLSVTPYYDYQGKTYLGEETARVACTSAKIGASVGSVTKISNKKARITINKSAGAAGTRIYQRVGSKWKLIGKTTKSSFSTSKNSAGKRKYRLQAYIVDAGKTYYSSYSKTYAPQSNMLKCHYSNRPAAYKKYGHYWRPNSFSYSGSKVLVKGKFINTHIYRLDYLKIKLTVKCQGKTIGTKTINSGKLQSNQVKNVSVKLDKSKTGYDLRAGKLSWSYVIVKWK